MKRPERRHEVPDLPEPVEAGAGSRPGFIAPLNWSDEEILDAMRAFEEHVRRERGLPPAEGYRG